jgi:hypothetical protein
MHWRELITGICESRTQEAGLATKPTFYPPALARDIVAAQMQLDVKLPPCLQALLLETNDVMDMLPIDGGESFENMWLLWTLNEIVEQNVSFRAKAAKDTHQRDFRQLVFFAGAGSDGILFAFPLLADRVCASNVVVWHPIEDELTEVAPSLEEFLQGWLTSSISI